AAGNNAVGSRIERAPDEKLRTAEQSEGKFTFQGEQAFEERPVAARILNPGEAARLEQPPHCLDFDSRSEAGNVVEQQGDNVSGFAGEDAVELFDFALTVAEEVGRHEHEGVGAGLNGIVR